MRWRDPLLGRSVLSGLLAGAVMVILNRPIARLLRASIESAPLIPAWPDWDTLVSPAQALAWVVFSLQGGATQALFFLVALVLLRFLLRNSKLAMMGTVLIWILLSGVSSWFDAIWSVVYAVLLMRWGMVALATASVLNQLFNYAATPSWTQWYSQASVIALLVVVALAIYGLWAATPGRSLWSEADD